MGTKFLNIRLILLLLIQLCGFMLSAQQDSIPRDSLLLRGSALQQPMMSSLSMGTMALPSAPVITYSVPSVLNTGTAVNYLPTNSGGAVYVIGDVGPIAGSTALGFVEGTGSAARFNVPCRMVADASGNIYICDVYNHRIRKMTPAGVVSTFVGNGTAALVNGTGTAASIYGPNDIARDGSGNFYISDRGNHVVRKVTPAGVVTTLAGAGVRGYAEGTGTAAKFNAPAGISVDGSGNVYIVDEGNYRIRKITPAGVVSTLAGGVNTSVDGTGTAAGFYGMKGLVIDASGNLYLAEYNASKIRKITPGGVVTTLAGSGTAGTVNGTGTSAGFYFPMGLSLDASGNIYVTQLDNRIRKVTPAGVVTTIAGTGASGVDNGPPLQATFNGTEGILWMPNGDLYIGDSQNHQIRKMGRDMAYSISPALPAGLTFNKNTGAISGTPTAATVSKSYTVTAYNAGGSGTKVITFGVNMTFGSSDQNYVLETVAREAFTSAEALASQGVGAVNRTIHYFDGLGRPLQDVSWQASPGKKDVVQHVEYDGFGRQTHQYLPYAEQTANDGSFKTAAKANQTNFYKIGGGWDAAVNKTGQPYSVTVFENSPLNRILQQGSPGLVWQPGASRTASTGRTVVSEYGTNVGSGTEAVRLWTVNATSTGATGTGFYAAGKLSKTVTKDENWVSGKTGTVEEFKDLEDRIVLKRIWKSESAALNTQYVYNGFGELCYVIPPGFTSTSVVDGDATFNELLYAYKYDAKGRQIKKKVPGKGWEWLVYNANDQVILAQDSVQRTKANKEWSYLKYDAFGRTVESGTLVASYATQVAAQTAADGHAASSNKHWEERTVVAKAASPTPFTKYTNLSFPIQVRTPRQVNYYDDHRFESADTTGLAISGLTYVDRNKTLLTGMRVFRDDGTSPTMTVNYYDERARLVQSVSQNHLGGTDRVTNTYNFPGELLSSKREHKASAAGAVTTLVTTNTYDHVGRPIDVRHKVNAQAEVLLSRSEYNELGQLKGKKLHSENSGTNFLTSIAYTYNERGWMSKSSAPQFTYQLNYATGGTPQYNGNISQQLWGHGATTVNTFTYGYDRLNRLTRASSTGVIMFERMEYDDMGNITKLVRNSQTAADTLGINYSYLVNTTVPSNRLQSLSGGFTGSYSYDVNGNATKDRTGMTFTYNHLNLPKTATRTGVSVSYLYDGAGNRLQKKLVEGANTVINDYLGEIEYYKLNSAASVIDRIGTSEGYLLPSGSTYVYHYSLTDHLGNVRSVVKRGATATAAEVVQKSDYYAFGKRHANSSYVYGENRYLYNGKELQDEIRGGTHAFGSAYVQEGQYDYGARFYDAEIGRWNVVDPLAEAAYDWSPYRYGYNNPIKFIDPTGMLESTHTDEDGNVIAVYNDGDLGVYRHVKNADGKSVTKAQLDKRHKNSTSAGGEKMGETEFWDEFIAPGDKGGSGRIIFDPSKEDGLIKVGNWDDVIADRNKKANNQDLTVTMEQSKLNGELDIKHNINYAPYGPMTGRLLNGKYATARSAGNFLAGLNGVTGTLQGSKISGLTYMKLAGAYQQGQLSMKNIGLIMLFGKSFGPAPYYGEQPYSGRRILQGINYGTKK